MSKVVLVFGSSKGIGKELTRIFLHEDFIVHGFSRSESDAGHNCFFHNLDLNSPSLKDDFIRLSTEIEKIDYVVYNAGNIAVKPFEELSKSEILQCYQVNVLSAFEILQVCIPKMNKNGHIVLISSMGGFQGTMKFPGLAAYSTSKAALASLAELLAEEYKQSDFSVNCLCLGAVQTEMLEKAFPGYKAPHTASEMASFIKDFTVNKGAFFNGKIIPVSTTTP